jgi:hypothetical protein
MRTIVLIVLFSFQIFQIRAIQFVLNFTPVFDGTEIHFNSSDYIINKDTIRFDVMRFYISSVSFYQNEKKVFSELNSFHLIDAENNLKTIIDIPANLSFDQIKFNLGIDSITNNSGAMGGDLDPTKGMYWTWQSGYINFKLEGTTSLNSDRNHPFEFHLGGYAFPNNSLRQVSLYTTNKNIIDVSINLKKFTAQIDFSKSNHVMSPGKDAMKLSSILAECFSIK